MAANFISRRWRSKGHGIHSPLAFRMVTEVLRQDYAFYAYPDIDRLCATPGEASMARLIHRLTCEFRPASAWIDPSLSRKPFAEAIKLAHRSTRLTSDPSEAEMLISASIPPALPEKGVFALTGSPSATPFDCFRSGCFTFSNGKALIALTRPDLPRQHFEVMF